MAACETPSVAVPLSPWVTTGRVKACAYKTYGKPAQAASERAYGASRWKNNTEAQLDVECPHTYMYQILSESHGVAIKSKRVKIGAT